MTQGADGELDTGVVLGLLVAAASVATLNVMEPSPNHHCLAEVGVLAFPLIVTRSSALE